MQFMQDFRAMFGLFNCLGNSFRVISGQEISDLDLSGVIGVR